MKRFIPILAVLSLCIGSQQEASAECFFSNRPYPTDDSICFNNTIFGNFTIEAPNAILYGDSIEFIVHANITNAPADGVLRIGCEMQLSASGLSGNLEFQASGVLPFDGPGVYSISAKAPVRADNRLGELFFDLSLWHTSTGNVTTELRSEIQIVRVLGDHDIDGSGEVTIADAVSLVRYMFNNGALPQPSKWNADVNCNEAITISDVTSFVRYVFGADGYTPPCMAVAP